MISTPVTRIAAAFLIAGSVALAPSLDEGLNSQDGDPVAHPAPHFRIHRQAGELSLSGHTASQEHEQTLLNIAETSYPDSFVFTEFQELGIVPANWAASTVELLKLLEEMRTADASLSTRELDIRGVIVDAAVWQSRLDALKESMPDEVTISARTILIDPTINISAICERAFETFDLGRINFEESSTAFRSSAYPRLDRLIALANACHNSRIAITGHTDGTGSEAWNRVLSLRRANAVGDYFVKGGIDRERLDISGIGSENPVADDRTRYGRSLNRRIEIELTPIN